MASTMLVASAMPLPAISKAVPWSTEVRMIGRPSVMLTPESGAPAAGRRIHVEAEQLHRDVPLVVVHGHHRVVAAAAQVHEHRVARHRPLDVFAASRKLRDQRLRDVDVLPTEDPAFAGMRVERRHGDPRPFQAQAPQGRQRQLDHPLHALGRHQVGHPLQRHMRGDMGHAEAAMRQHQHRAAGAGQVAPAARYGRGSGSPAAFSAALFSGAVTMASTSPASASSTERATAW